MGARRGHLCCRPGQERPRARRPGPALRSHGPRLPRWVPRRVVDWRRARSSSFAGRIRAPGCVREPACQRRARRGALGGLRRPPDGGPPARIRPARAEIAGDRAADAGGRRPACSGASRRRRRNGAHPVHLGKYRDAARRGDHRGQPGGQRGRHGQGPAPDARGPGGVLAAALPRHGPHRRPPRAARAWRRLLAALAARVHAPSGELDAGGVGRARHPHRGAQLRVRPSRPEGFRRGSAGVRPLQPPSGDQWSRAGRPRHRRGVLQEARSDGLPRIELLPGLRTRGVHAGGRLSSARPGREDRSRASRRAGERLCRSCAGRPRHDSRGLRRPRHRRARDHHRQRQSGSYSAARAQAGADLDTRTQHLTVVLRAAPRGPRAPDLPAHGRRRVSGGRRALRRRPPQGPRHRRGPFVFALRHRASRRGGAGRSRRAVSGLRCRRPGARHRVAGAARRSPASLPR